MFVWHSIALQTCILLFCHTSLYSCAKLITNSAYIVAAQTGATQYKEYTENFRNTSKENQKRYINIKKNPSRIQENYDIFQGVVGRPGIDFPILRKIPITNFDCVQYGNGYFADLDTKCQVFHICDEGKKLSFLCPNGTIFRQLDLICDWWFKVDCTASLNHYAESSEMLTQAQRARIQSKYPIPQPIESPEQFSLKTQRKHALLNNPLGPNLNALAINRRMDTTVDESIEAIDLEDITFKRKKAKKNDNDSVNTESSEEFQATDESASFLTGYRKQRGYKYPPPEKLFNHELKSAKFISWNDQEKEPSQRTPTNFDYENGRQSESGNSIPSNIIPLATRISPPTTTVGPFLVRQHTLKATTVSTVSRGSTTHQTSTLNKKMEQKLLHEYSLKQKTPVSSTPSTINFNIYTTARKPITKSKDKPYYTPTVPTITNKAHSEETSAITLTSVTPSVDPAEHAIEMMKTLQNLDLPEPESDFRTRFEIPPSSGPNVLHSLALYFANDSGNTSTTSGISTQMRTEEFAPRNNYNTLSSSLLSRKTIDKYSQLFGGRTSKPKEKSFDYTVRINERNDLEGQYSGHPLFGEFESSQVRELAQVFTHALSAYLKDPDSFRRILSEIRPKAPSKRIQFDHLGNRLRGDDYITVEEASHLATHIQITHVPGNVMMDNSEVQDFSDVTLPTTVKRETTVIGIEITTEMPIHKAHVKGTPASKYITNNLEKNAAAYRERQNQNSRASVDLKNDLAQEVNKELETLKPQLLTKGLHIKQFDGKIESSSSLDLATSTDATPSVNFELLLPRNELTTNISKEFLYHDHDDLLEDDEQLQRAQSQYRISDQNQEYTNLNKSQTSKSYILETNKDISDFSIHQTNKKGHYEKPPRDTYVSAEVTPSSPKATISYTVFLDPLTINDGLIDSDEAKATTISNANNYLSKTETKSLNSYTSPTAPSNITTVKLIRSRTGKSRAKKLYNKDDSDGKLVFDAMQMKANQIFGKLNDEEAEHLMHVMKTADTNKSVRRLILLLIQTCDDNYYKTAEESRKLLLNALMNIDIKEDDSSDVRIVSSKLDLGKSTTTFSTPTVTHIIKPFERLTGVTAGFELESRSIFETTTAGYEDINSTIMDLSIETYTKFNELRSNSGETETTTLTLSDQAEQFTTFDTPTTTIDHETTTVAPTPTEMPSTTPIQSDENKNSKAIQDSTSYRFPKQLESALDYVAESNTKKSIRYSDTRALELLRSLYSLASRWG